MKLPVLPGDKANHFAYGAVLTALGALHSVGAGLLVCAVFAVGKEVYDFASRRGVADRWDVVATLAGALPVLLPLTAWRLA